MNKADLSIVIPAYNEEKSIETALRVVREYVRRKGITCQYIVVDDGSCDQTAALAKNFFHGTTDLHQIIQLERNSGKGWAVKQGMLAAYGKFVLFMDADLSVPIDSLDHFLKKFDDGYDIVIGTRKVKESYIEVHQNPVREFLGKCFTFLSNCILNTRYSDFTCGFKIFTREAAQVLFTLQKVSGWSFDSEILYLAHKKGYKVLEQPVRWRNDPNTKVKLSRDILSSIIELIQIRIRG